MLHAIPNDFFLIKLIVFLFFHSKILLYSSCMLLLLYMLLLNLSTLNASFVTTKFIQKKKKKFISNWMSHSFETDQIKIALCIQISYYNRQSIFFTKLCFFFLIIFLYIFLNDFRNTFVLLFIVVQEVVLKDTPIELSSSESNCAC